MFESKLKEEHCEQLLGAIPSHIRIQKNVPLSQYTTLRVGGPADLFYQARNLEDLASVSIIAQKLNFPTFVLGSGSNLLPSDLGVRALVIQNDCRKCSVGETTYAECGISFQEIFLASAQAGLSGLEFAVGIPGTLGGALVSNAGAYRANICDLLIDIDLITDGERKTVRPEWMEFSYRDSILRRPNPPAAMLLAVHLKLSPAKRVEIFATAREIQRQRIEKQPPESSAGSFFKNVLNAELAQKISELPDGLRKAGVVPAGYLIAEAGLKGTRLGGASISVQHANFLINNRSATASDIRSLAEFVKTKVFERFGITLEEEVLYVGDWTAWKYEALQMSVSS